MDMTSTKIFRRAVGDVTILSVRGKITHKAGDIVLREAVQEALAAGRKQLVLDLSGVSTIDTSGVGELVSAFTTVTNRGGRLKLLNIPLKVHDILQITQLSTVFDQYEDEPAAVASF